MAKQNVRIGISGWTFEGWRGTFYPKTVKQKDELAYASKIMTSIEINGTFYSLQRPHTFQKWYDETPENFVFAIKAPKYITHERRLKDFEHPLANFLASGLMELKQKLGVILWQFPPTLPYKPERFEPFFAALPHTFKDAAETSKNHSEWMAERAVTATDYTGEMRHAVEVRHESFKCQEFVDLCRKYKVAIVVGDTAGKWPYMEDVTSNFMYLRLHADELKYPKGYTREALERWEERARIWTAGDEPADAVSFSAMPTAKDGRLVFMYFDNDTKETAPINALFMLEKFGEYTPPKETVAKKTSPVKRKKSSVPKRKTTKSKRKAA